MNLHHATPDELTDILTKSVVLDSWALPGGGKLFVAEYAGNDVLIFSEAMQGTAVVVEANDANYGGSIHEHLRHAKRLGVL